MKSIGIIGYGQFGKFVAQHLSAYASVKAYDPNGGTHDLKTVCASDLLVFAVTAQRMEDAALAAAPLVPPETLIADVCSVKVRPLEILKHHFPKNSLLGTHPIFGPQSGKNGIAGLPVVLCNVSWAPSVYADVKEFLATTLKLTVIEKTPEEHDLEMARVQGLAHFIGRALKEIAIQDYDTSTYSYKQLLKLRDLLKDDSWELFKTIENENPYAADVRRGFLAVLESLNTKLDAEATS